MARIDKLRADPARDAKLVAEMAPLLTQYQRARSALKGAPDPRLDEFRWLPEELRVALFAQELRTPMPVSVKRLMKSWESIDSPRAARFPGHADGPAKPAPWHPDGERLCLPGVSAVAA